MPRPPDGDDDGGVEQALVPRDVQLFVPAEQVGMLDAEPGFSDERDER